MLLQLSAMSERQEWSPLSGGPRTPALIALALILSLASSSADLGQQWESSKKEDKGLLLLPTNGKNLGEAGEWVKNAKKMSPGSLDGGGGGWSEPEPEEVEVEGK